jgi:hypothetical protein
VRRTIRKTEALEMFRKLFFRLFELVYFAALLLAYLSLFRLVFETGYMFFLLKSYGLG